MLIAQKISRLLGGVSQQPAETRPSIQAESQENVLSHWTYGTRRRPPTKHVAKLTSSTSYGSAFFHEVRQTLTDRYYVVVVGGDLKVYDAATGVEQTVAFPKGKSYLTSTKGFKAFTVGDVTYLLNRDVTVKRGDTKATAQAKEALIFVRQADYSTRYTVTLNGVSIEITTPDGSSPLNREGIATDSIAQQLIEAIEEDNQLGEDFLIEPFGSTIYVARKDGDDFDISASDGLADKGLRIIKGAVQSSADLPARARAGMIVKVSGDPEASIDDYFVVYSDEALPGQMGVWVECAAPGTPVELDGTTMPWALQRKGLIVDNLVADAPPQPPTIIPETTVVSGGFTLDPDTSDTYTGDQDIALTKNDQRVDATLSGVDGTERNLRVYYDVDTTLLDFGQYITVEFFVKLGGGGTFVSRASNTYQAGEKLSTEMLQWSGDVPSGSMMRVQIHYGSAETPESRFREAIVTVHRSGSPNGGGATSVTYTATIVSFNPDAIYPVGTSVALSLSDTLWSGNPRSTHINTFTYAVTGSDKTGAQVATGLYNLTNGNSESGSRPQLIAATQPSAGLIRFSGAPLDYVVSVAITQSPLTLFLADAPFIGSEHVGKILFNTTDGSQGTITANGTHTVTVASLTGGIHNTIVPGDVCIIQAAAQDFVFSTVEWAQRTAGDLENCPLPSFVDRSLNEVFFFQNRLGFTADQYVVLSEVGNATNFMRTTAAQLLPSDVIDIRSAYPQASTFDHAIEWNEKLILASASGHQFAVSGEPLLSPQTVQMKLIASFPMSAAAKPVTIGKFLFFGRAKGKSTKFTQIQQMFADANDKADAFEITQDVPQYLTGSPLQIVGDSAMEVLAVLTSTALDTLWVHTYHYAASTSQYSEPQKLMSAWSKWTFSGATVLYLAMDDGVISLLVQRSDGVYLEEIDLGNLPAATDDHRDRQGSSSPVSSTMRWRISTIYKRNLQTDVAETRGRLQMRFVTFSYHDTTDFTVTVTPLGRGARVKTFHAAAASAGQLQVPVLTQNTQATIEVTNATNGGCAFSALDWEADFTIRDKRV